MFGLLFGTAVLITSGVMAKVRCPPENGYTKTVLTTIEGGLSNNNGTMRTINLNEMIANCTRLSRRVPGTAIADAISELVSRLRQISPSDVEMLADAQRSKDNELVDNVFVANNLVRIMSEYSDEELKRNPPSLGPLIYASNNIQEYLRTHRRSRLAFGAGSQF